jgi:hypothetical protein
MLNRRKRIRRTARKEASILGAEDERVLAIGFAENVSDEGACIVLDMDVELPVDFIVSIPAERVERRGRLVWKTGERLGISFQ